MTDYAKLKDPEITRYDLQNTGCSFAIGEQSDGRYVLYSDHAAALAAKEAHIAELATHAAVRERIHHQQMAGLDKLLKSNAELTRQLEAMERLVRELMRDTGAGSLRWSYWKDHNPQGESESREEWLTRFNRDEAKHSAEFETEIQAHIKQAKEQG